jgi:hypothetical protein
MARHVLSDVPALGTKRNKLREAAVQTHKRMNSDSSLHTTQAWLKILHSSPQGDMEEPQESFALKVVKHRYSVGRIPSYLPRHSVGKRPLPSINEDKIQVENGGQVQC